ncbi:bola [Pyrrhoderma noxium]|uniref:Bola n=1 Tax=Pyrrhoderma noxium TaxID=2282107 RepID=A0A286UNG6_9AGAM|nr:bola [Pyrrhoderma noxium]
MFSISRSLWRSASQAPRLASNSHGFGFRRAYSVSQQLSEGEQKIHDLLRERFEASNISVEDISGGCGSFYAISITSKAFAGIPIVKQHRLVNETLKSVIPNIHGLQLKTVAEDVN